MEPAEISLLLLRHLARDGCVETIRTYVNECPAVMQSLTVASGGAHPDLEFFRQKLLNRSVNINLTDLLSEYGRAKSMIQDLVSKLLFEWKALSTYFLSPHDSMATQLAHITNLLESKCKSSRTDSKCVGTSDDATFAGLGAGLGHDVRKEGVDVGIQTAEEEEAESAVEIPEESSDIPSIVSSLLDPPMIEKMVEIANKEKLNRSNQSENILANDTETEIDKMLLDILHGMGGNPIPSNALNLGCNSVDSAAPDQSSVDPQLMDLFQYAQSTIVHTPVPGTLVRPEDSVSKQKPCGSFLDLIDTPFKSAFISIPNTPVGKIIGQNEVEKPMEKPVQPVELNFGPIASVPPGPPDISSNSKSDVTRGFIIKPKPGPKYSIVRGSEAQVPAVSQDLQRVRKKRDITPRIPTVQCQATTTETSSISNASLVRSVSKRKFNTPVKLSPVKALLAPSVNFYCPSSSVDKLNSAYKTDVQTSSIETPLKILPAVEFPSITTPVPPKVPSCVPGNPELSHIKSQLPTINYQDLLATDDQSKKTSATSQEIPASTKLTTDGSTAKQTPVSESNKPMAANMTTPDLGLLEKSSINENPDVSPTPMYSRMLSSVRHARPSSMLLKQKSFSTPRKKGHIRNLIFKTPPSATSERTENSSINFSANFSGKRKANPSPPLGNKSKKRLKWNNLVGETKNNSSVSDETAAVLPINPSPPTSQMMADIASKIVGQSAVSTRSRSTRNSQANAKSTQKSTRQTRGSTLKKTEESPSTSEAVFGVSVQPSISVVSPPVAASNRRSSKRLDEQRAADAAVSSAIPLGARSLPSRNRVTRRKSKLDTCEQNDQNQTADPRSNIWLTQMDVKNVETIPPPSGFGDSCSADSNKPATTLNTITISAALNPQDGHFDKAPTSCSKPTQEDQMKKVTDKVINNPASPAFILISPPSKEVTKGSTSDKKQRSKIRKGAQEIENKSGTDASKAIVKVKSKPVHTVLSGLPTKPVTSSAPSVILNERRRISLLGDFQKKSTPFPNLTSGLNRDENMANAISNVGNKLATENITRAHIRKPEPTPCSPSRGRPRSPKKSPNKNPRRILPKPVPPDHPRPVFPPPNQNSGYILSIPSTSPTTDNDDSLSVHRNFISPVALVSETPLKKPGLTLSSSDSSLELSNSVPKTPRLKNDSGEDTTTSRLFLGIRNDSISVGAGIPIFSSTPMKFPPETPGKNLPGSGGAVIIEGDSSTRTSLFDTPLKVPSPPKPTSIAQQNLEVSIEKIMTKTVEFSENLSSQTVIPRKSPRKSNSPLKCRVKTPRKAKTPMKSVQKLPSKTSFEYKPTRRTPYKSPLPKKMSASPGRKSSDEEEKTSLFAENQAHGSQQIRNTQEKKSSTPFANLCTKSKSFMRLSEVARRGKSILSANSTETSTLTASSALIATVPAFSKEEKTNGKSVKSADVHFQFAVSGRTKQLSLSEHESLIGLLQIGSIKTQQKKQPRIQKLDTDLLSNIDLHKFLRTVHAGE